MIQYPFLGNTVVKFYFDIQNKEFIYFLKSEQRRRMMEDSKTGRRQSSNSVHVKSGDIFFKEKNSHEFI